jgi:hypothetical protein
MDGLVNNLEDNLEDSYEEEKWYDVKFHNKIVKGLLTEEDGLKLWGNDFQHLDFTLSNWREQAEILEKYTFGCNKFDVYRAIKAHNIPAVEWIFEIFKIKGAHPSNVPKIEPYYYDGVNFSKPNWKQVIEYLESHLGKNTCGIHIIHKALHAGNIEAAIWILNINSGTLSRHAIESINLSLPNWMDQIGFIRKHGHDITIYSTKSAFIPGNIEAIKWVLMTFQDQLNVGDLLKQYDLSEMEYHIFEFLVINSYLILDEYLFDRNICDTRNFPIKHVDLLLKLQCSYTDYSLSLSLNNKNYKLYKYLRSKGINWVRRKIKIQCGINRDPSKILDDKLKAENVEIEWVAELTLNDYRR